MLLFIMFLNPTMNATQCRENTQALSVADVAANGVLSDFLVGVVLVVLHLLPPLHVLENMGTRLAKRRCRSSKPQQFSVYPGT